MNDFLAITVAILTLLATVLIGWQVYQIINFNNILSKRIKVALTKAIQDNNKTVAACVHQIQAMMYAGYIEKDITSAFMCYMDAIDELNSATNTEPLEDIVSQLSSLVEENFKLINLAPADIQKYKSICKKSEYSAKLLVLIDLVEDSTRSPKPQTIIQSNQNGDNQNAGRDNFTILNQ